MPLTLTCFWAASVREVVRQWYIMIFMHVGEGMVPDICIRKILTIRFKKVLGRCHISTQRDSENVEPVINNGLVAGLLDQERVDGSLVNSQT